MKRLFFIISILFFFAPDAISQQGKDSLLGVFEGTILQKKNGAITRDTITQYRLENHSVNCLLSLFSDLGTPLGSRGFKTFGLGFCERQNEHVNIDSLMNPDGTGGGLIHFIGLDSMIFFYLTEDPQFNQLSLVFKGKRISGPSNIAEIKSSINLTIAPNPGNADIFIKAPTRGDIRIINILGAVIMEQRFEGELRWNVEKLPQGLYWVELNSHTGEKLVERFVKN
ncbi:MAG: hypothetical protein ACI9YL_002214 [Luteibaculaceae bacterium]|jgi:hypothetical protein